MYINLTLTQLAIAVGAYTAFVLWMVYIILGVMTSTVDQTLSDKLGSIGAAVRDFKRELLSFHENEQARAVSMTVGSLQEAAALEGPHRRHNDQPSSTLDVRC